MGTAREVLRHGRRPSTIVELADTLEDKYDIEMPFVDLFRWGTPEADATTSPAPPTSGRSNIDGVTCEQYAFRQKGSIGRCGFRTASSRSRSRSC